MGRMPTGDKHIRGRRLSHAEFKVEVTTAVREALEEAPFGVTAVQIIERLDPDATAETKSHIRNELNRMVMVGLLRRAERGILLPGGGREEKQHSTPKADTAAHILDFMRAMGGWATRSDLLKELDREKGKFGDNGQRGVDRLLVESSQIRRAWEGVYHLRGDERRRAVLEGRWVRNEIKLAAAKRTTYDCREEPEADAEFVPPTVDEAFDALRAPGSAGPDPYAYVDVRGTLDAQQILIDTMSSRIYYAVGSVSACWRRALRLTQDEVARNPEVRDGFLYSFIDTTAWGDDQIEQARKTYEGDAFFLHLLEEFETGGVFPHALLKTRFYEALGDLYHVSPADLSRGIILRNDAEEAEKNYIRQPANMKKAMANQRARDTRQRDAVPNRVGKRRT